MKHTIARLRAIAIIGLVGAVAPPLLQAQTTETYTYTTNRLVPDGNAAGLQDARTINSAIGAISSIKVRLKTAGEFNGDLYGYLRHVDNSTTNFVVLLNRPGRATTNSAGYADSGLDVTFQNGASNGDVHFYRGVSTPLAGLPLTGIWQPDGRNVDPTNVTEIATRNTSLTNFNFVSASGDWTLYLADIESGGTNMLKEWALEISGGAYPTLAWPTPPDIVYGTALGASQLNATAFYNATPVPGTFNYSYSNGTVLNSGSNQTITVTFTPTDSVAYLPVSTNVTINVQKAPLTITASSSSKIYGQAVTFAGTEFTSSGLVGSDSITSVTLTSSGASALAGVTGSPYAIVPSAAVGSGLANYNVSYVNGLLTVNTRPLTIAANNTNKTYGDTLTFAGTEFSVSGLVNSDAVASVTLTSAGSVATAGVAGSPYAITPSAAVGTGLVNYAIGYSNGTLTVAPASITVAANNKSKVYGAPLPALTATYTGFVLSQTTNDLAALATLSTTATPSSAPGVYPITASGASSPNYAFTYVPGTLTITQSLSIAAVASSANPAVPGSSVTFTATLSAVAPGVGTPSGSVQFRIDGSVAGSGTLSGGIATFSTTTLALGTHTVVAEYSGDLNFIGTTNALTPDQLINTAPVAGTVAIDRYPTQGTKVSLATLLAASSDADGDTLGITVSSTSASNATITVSQGWVFYTPAPGFTNVDSFTYTVTDPRGGSAIGTVTVAIKVDDSVGVNLAITDLHNGSFRVNGSGIPGRTYRIQYTDSLVPANWQSLGGSSVTADNAGAFQFIDATGSSTRFYRTVWP